MAQIYGLYNKDGSPFMIDKNAKGKKIEPYHLRAGTKGAARRKAKDHDVNWRKDGLK